MPCSFPCRETARAAAFRDRRFTPLSAGELAATRVEVSFLTLAEPTRFATEEDAVRQLRQKWSERRQVSISRPAPSIKGRMKARSWALAPAKARRRGLALDAMLRAAVPKGTATEDIDVLVKASRDNGERVIRALNFLKSSEELNAGWFLPPDDGTVLEAAFRV